MQIKTSMPSTGNSIKVISERFHSKASEAYSDVIFYYPDLDKKWEGSVPWQYRRTGVFAETPEQKQEVLNNAYDAMHPKKAKNWLLEQKKFWDQSNKAITRPFFEALKSSQWTCQVCQFPKNPNWARRIQDIKEMGYTLATHTSRYCLKCKKNTTQLILLKLSRGGTSGYETWSPQLRKRILNVLKHWDAYERCVRITSLLPDHKFPEIRWDANTKEKNLDDMSVAEIKAKFQLLSNQRNQQKREVCRTCFQTNLRGTPHGIKFFYEGNENWSSNIPKIGKEAEKGCVGCGWYDLDKWHEKLSLSLSSTT